MHGLTVVSVKFLHFLNFIAMFFYLIFAVFVLSLLKFNVIYGALTIVPNKISSLSLQQVLNSNFYSVLFL